MEAVLMKSQSLFGFVMLALGLASSCLGQKVVVIHAAQLFDGKSDRLASNQVIVIQGERIVEVGPAGSVKIPAGAQEIDLGTGTILPGLIEGHNHMFKIADHGGADTDTSVPAVPIPGTAFSLPYATILASVNARLDLLSGFTTARDLTSGGTADVDLRNAINEGLIPGPRMQVATEGLRGSIAGPRYFHLVDSPWEGRKQVRIQLKNGADFIKIFVAGFRQNPDIGYGAPTMTLEEEQAIVDEAHRQGVRVACTCNAGVAARQSVEAGCDSLELVGDIDPETVRKAVEKGTFMTFGMTRIRIIAATQNFPLADMSKASFQRALKAGVKIALGVNATGAHGKQEGPYHGEEAAELNLMVEYGMTPLQAMRSATSVGAANIGWSDRVGAIEKGKYADIIGVSGNPANDITELGRVKFVMKGGQVFRNDFKLSKEAPSSR
jgi:imidazolonepropionase-like amidohydrolase